jgi:hypothetical protein
MTGIVGAMHIAIIAGVIAAEEPWVFRGLIPPGQVVL